MINFFYSLIMILIITNILSVQFFLKKLEKKNDLLLSMRARGMEPALDIAANAKEVTDMSLDDEMNDTEPDKLIDPRDMDEDDLQNLDK